MAATISATESQLEFYKSWLMARESFSPSDFGVNLPKSEFAAGGTGGLSASVSSRVYKERTGGQAASATHLPHI